MVAVVIGMLVCSFLVFFFFKQKPAYEMRISDWSSDVCSSDLGAERRPVQGFRHPGGEAVIEAMYGYRGRQSLRHFTRERWPGNYRQWGVPADMIVRDFMQKTARTGLETLARPGDAGERRAQCGQCAQGIGKGVAGHGHQNPLRAGNRFGEVGGGDRESVGWGKSGSVGVEC